MFGVVVTRIGKPHRSPYARGIWERWRLSGCQLPLRREGVYNVESHFSSAFFRKSRTVTRLDRKDH